MRIAIDAKTLVTLLHTAKKRRKYVAIVAKEATKKVECPDKNASRKCIPCSNRGKQCVNELKECSTYKLMLKRKSEKITENYGI